MGLSKPRLPEPRILGDVAVGPDGDRRWFQLTDTPLSDGRRLTGWRTIGREITQWKATEEALEVARRRAEAASAAKSRFLAMVSHELRTPLNGILGMTGLLMQSGLTPEQRTYARAVETSGEALLLLIEDLLDFSKIEAGRMDLSPRPTLLAETVEELVELMAPRAAAKGIELAAYVDPRLPAEVDVDPVRLKQVLFNLAGNGIKFTAEGGVAVEVWDAGPPDPEGRRPVLFQVRDTGIGIDAQDAERIFLEFEQADPGHARAYGGTGLGLAIARQLVALMGGTITLESRPGSGACFSFTLPLSPSGEAATPHPSAAASDTAATGPLIDRLTGARAAQERLFALFSSNGLSPEISDTTPAADAGALQGMRIAVVSHALVEAPFILRRLFDAGADVVLLTQRDIEASLAADPPDAVLVDAAVGDAIALIDRIRMVTAAPACVLIDPRERPLLPDLQAAGYRAFLVKPVRRRSLTSAVRMLTAGSTFDAADAGESGPPAAPAGGTAAADDGVPLRRVLLCDDNEINLLLGRGLLERLGAAVSTASTGQQAAHAAREALDAELPFDLILMDIHMPEVDGVAAARAIRAHPAGRRPVIAALTADALARTRDDVEPDLFDAWLTKPLMPSDLKAVLDALALAAERDRAG
jgi:signal transduction histidine kinase/CheY-like chemotaxis protein